MSIWYDVFIIMIIFTGMLIGFSMGMVRQLINVFGLYFGLVFASYFQPGLSRFATRLLGEAETLSRESLIFFVTFVLMWLFINLGGYFSFREAPRFLPAALDRLVGMLLGAFTAIVAVVVMTLLLSYATDVPWPRNNALRAFIQNGIQASILSPLFVGLIPTVAASIEPWIPRGLPAFFQISP